LDTQRIANLQCCNYFKDHVGSTATITWNTNENTDSQVEYGTTTAYGQSTTLNPSLVTAHSQTLTGLTAGTVYHYRVKSRDAAGNLAYWGDFTFTTAQSVPTDGLASLSYNGANNRINTPGFEYDPAGNQTTAIIDNSGTRQQYRYDCANRLVQVLDGNGNVMATYSYGAGNQRLVSIEGGVTKYHAWAGGQIIAGYEASGANALIWKTSYVYLGGQLLATTSGADGTETRFHHPDRLGTRLVTDASGTVVSEQLSMPFGTMLPFTQTYGGENSYQHPTLANPSKKRFTTYDRSDATNLDYAVNRFYSPQQGRFTQVDPIGMSAVSLSNPQTLNLYAYCGNDPINCVDPDGLFFGIGSLFRAIGRAIVSAVKAVIRLLSAGRGASSGPGFRTPPTFPGSLPGTSIGSGGGLGGFRTPPFVNGFQQTQDDSLGAFFERLGNFLSGNGYKTNREVEIDKLRAFEAKRREAYAGLKALGATDEQLGQLTAQGQIEAYEAAKRGDSSVTTSDGRTIYFGAAAPPSDPLPPVNKAVNTDIAHAAEQATERGIFPDAKSAGEGLRNLTREITPKKGFPEGSILDTARSDRVLVPVGKGGYAVYQVLKNGTARLKTVLIAK
jgi:RHS repeat-associated protein